MWGPRDSLSSVLSSTSAKHFKVPTPIAKAKEKPKVDPKPVASPKADSKSVAMVTKAVVLKEESVSKKRKHHALDQILSPEKTKKAKTSKRGPRSFY